MNNTTNNKEKPAVPASPFGTVEPTAEERERIAKESGAVSQDDMASRKKDTLLELARELEEATAWEKRAEAEYHNAVMKRIECFNILIRAVNNIENS